MKTKILDKTGKEKSSIELPINFSATIRPDILLKVFEAKKFKQPTGTMFGAGAGYSASGIIRKKRHAWKVSYGRGISRVPRKIMSRDGSNFNWVGATTSGTRGGRQAHPPKSEENQFKKINQKEYLIAMNSGFTGTVDKKSLERKYEGIENFGFVFDSSVLGMKTKEFFAILKDLFKNDYGRVLKQKVIRAGRGKARGRKYKSNAGLLFVIASDEKMNQKGISVISVNEIKLSDLSPNGEAGRIACYTEKAIKEIGEKF